MQTRADFLASTLATAGAVTAPSFASTLRTPPLVRAGDTVGLVAPASPLGPDEIVRGIEHIKKLGLVPKLGTSVYAATGYLAGSDAERAADFNRMAADPSVRAIIALRGGYGTMRILELLDYQALARDPKVVMGFSDMTAVVNAIAVRANIVTFHGPVAARESNYGDGTLDFIRRAWMRPEAIGTLPAPAGYTLARGRSSGRLAGGNLTLVASLEGTPYAVPTTNSLLVLEETEEAPYRVDRMLTQLRLAGALGSAAGVVFGQCTKCMPSGASWDIDAVLHDRLTGLGIPVFGGAPIGHIDEQWVLPIGLPATLDADAKTLTIPHPAVSPLSR